jgi:hypothetical protein
MLRSRALLYRNHTIKTRVGKDTGLRPVPNAHAAALQSFAIAF